MSVIKFIVYLAMSVLAGSVCTYLLISNGIDWSLAKFYNEHELFVWISTPFVLAGMFVPILLIGMYYYLGKSKKQHVYAIQYKRSLYSFAFTYILMTVLKVFTNRVDMEPFEPIGNKDISAQFRFGFINSNSWWESLSEGWPSGHTMIAVGMAIAIHPLLQRKLWRSINIVYPILVAWSVSTAFHWLSDVIAGAVMGVVIGYYYRTKWSKESFAL